MISMLSLRRLASGALHLRVNVLEAIQIEEYCPNVWQGNVGSFPPKIAPAWGKLTAKQVKAQNEFPPALHLITVLTWLDTGNLIYDHFGFFLLLFY